MTKSPTWYGVRNFLVRLVSLFHISWICLIWLKMDIFSWRFFLKYSCLCGMWWIEYYFIFLVAVDLRQLPCIVVLLLVFFFQLLGSIHWSYFLQGKRGYMAIVCLLGDIVYFLILIVFVNGVNISTYWCKSYIIFKYIIFDEGLVW